LKLEKVVINPTARYGVKGGDVIIVLGKRKDIERLK